MPHWKAILTYDGTPFHGWQIQPGLPTVQGRLAQALHHITGETVLPQGSGRTDTGVHALGQVATFSLASPIPASNLHRALNRALPSSIRVLFLESVPADFHARHSALRKTYEYRIFPTSPTRICSPMLAPFVWDCHHALDLDRLQQAATHILGTHDFTSFAAADPDLSTRQSPNPPDQADQAPRDQAPRPDQAPRDQAPSPDRVAHPSRPCEGWVIVQSTTALTQPPEASTDPPQHTTALRTIHHSSWHQEHDLFLYRITGSGFLHHMVRNLVGTFIEASIGRIEPDDIPAILAIRDRSAAGPTAPARGLFLVEVIYPESQPPLEPPENR